MLASVIADTSRMEGKLQELLADLPKDTPDELLGMISGLTDKVITVDSSVAFGADGALNIICTLDFDVTAYDQVVAATRAFKRNITHVG